MEIKDLRLFKTMPTLFTDRLILRGITKQDAQDIFDYSKRKETTKYLLWYPHISLRDTKRHIALVLKKYKRCEYYDFAIQLRDSGKMIGTCGFTRLNPLDDIGEIGYVINPSYQNRGYATEAVKRIIKFGFEELLLERIEARYIIGNDASLRVMKKCSMTEEGVLRNGIKAKGIMRDVGVCSILYSEYISSA